MKSNNNSKRSAPKRSAPKGSKNGNGNEPEVFVNVSDELYDELLEFAGQQVMSFSLWEDSLTDALEEGLQTSNGIGSTEQSAANPDAEMFDLDLYLEGGLYFELYGASFFPEIDADPLVGFTWILERLSALISGGIWLDEIAVDENEQLVLVLSQHHQPVLYLPVGGWVVEEWDELPD